jgi:hypothetical protein
VTINAPLLRSLSIRSVLSTCRKYKKDGRINLEISAQYDDAGICDGSTPRKDYDWKQ